MIIIEISFEGLICDCQDWIDVEQQTKKSQNRQQFRGRSCFATGAPALQEPAVPNLKPQTCV